ncbi:response regulator [Burkholderia glumae]|uniref:Response regulator n=1 Tax=Burkholderia glumae TaxID=337 RepID=A0AAP9XXM2_BURGL|nr:response regulator [Burkholderia glumae]ACR32310.1 Response regulator receiver protein [Burkholderia glumae BGR1]AJY64669.1 response regulator [Burkholderia glumae LMG 2196 = ATCC 33617]KHJ61814.1 chemotaxis protein CheY [Burkholderia glumae]MCM2484499.1 response regulator [Burkholderia glumae]MCM2494867.1 response regulator [Burkholderia glumae]
MSKSILLVDDSVTMLMSLRGSLEMAGGLSVETASDGVQALKRLRSGPRPDLIITDINMPNMDGLELIRQARQLPGLRFTPLLVLTTESQQARRDEAKALGATGWLVKPVATAALLQVIKQVLPGV